MRIRTIGTQTFYYPDERVDLYDGRPLKFIVDNPTGYSEGDNVNLKIERVFAGDYAKPFIVTSPLVGGRATFYVPIPLSYMQAVNFFINWRGNAPTIQFGFLNKAGNSEVFGGDIHLILMGSKTNRLLPPIPVVWWTNDVNIMSAPVKSYPLRIDDTYFDEGGNNLLEGTSSQVVTYTKEAYDWNIKRVPFADIPTLGIVVGAYITLKVYIENPTQDAKAYIIFTGSTAPMYRGYSGNVIPARASGWSTCTIQIKETDLANLTDFFVSVRGTNSPATTRIGSMKLEIGNKASPWTPSQTERPAGRYPVKISFQRLIDGVWAGALTGASFIDRGDLHIWTAAKDLRIISSDIPFLQASKVCKGMIQLIWGEIDSDTVRMFWFKVKETIYDTDDFGTIRTNRRLADDELGLDRATIEDKFYFPKKKLVLTTGLYEREIINMIAPIAASPVIWQYVDEPKYLDNPMDSYAPPLEQTKYEIANIDRKSIRVDHYETGMGELEITLNIDYKKPDFVIF